MTDNNGEAEVSDPFEVPDYFKDTLDVLRCAFPNPNAIPHTTYLALLAVMYNNWGMSSRSVASAVALFIGEDLTKYVYYYNDALWACSVDGPPQEEIDRVIEKLRPCGYDKLLDEE